MHVVMTPDGPKLRRLQESEHCDYEQLTSNWEYHLAVLIGIVGTEFTRGE